MCSEWQGLDRGSDPCCGDPGYHLSKIFRKYCKSVQFGAFSGKCMHLGDHQLMKSGKEFTVPAI